MKGNSTQSSKAASKVPVVVFGLDEHGKPKGARFGQDHAALAAKAAAALKLQVLAVTNGTLAQLAAKLPIGRVHANGGRFLSSIRRDVYTKLVAAGGADATPPNGQAEALPQGKGDGPRHWDEIAPGHVVVAQDTPTEGWYEAVVVERQGEMLSLRWRDYPRERKFARHRLALALLYPHNKEAKTGPTQSAAANKAKSLRGSASTSKGFPAGWGDIDVDHLVLAKEDGPWRGWWEAVVAQKDGDSFVLTWRDHPQVPKITRPGLSLALLHPNP